MRGLLVAQRVDQHRGEAVDRVGRLAGGGREVLHRQREERPVGQRVTVEQQQPRRRRGRQRRAGAGHGVTAPILGWPHDSSDDRADAPTTCDAVPAPSASGTHGRAHGAGGHRGVRRAASSARCRSRANTQPYGLLHGGASVVLAETLGSFGLGAARGRGPDRGRHRDQRHAPPGGQRRAGHRRGHRRSSSGRTAGHLGRRDLRRRSGRRVCTAGSPACCATPSRLASTQRPASGAVRPWRARGSGAGRCGAGRARPAPAVVLGAVEAERAAQRATVATRRPPAA